MDARYGEARRLKDEAKPYNVLELDNSSRGELASSAVIAVAACHGAMRVERHS